MWRHSFVFQKNNFVVALTSHYGTYFMLSFNIKICLLPAVRTIIQTFWICNMHGMHLSKKEDQKSDLQNKNRTYSTKIMIIREYTLGTCFLYQVIWNLCFEQVGFETWLFKQVYRVGLGTWLGLYKKVCYVRTNSFECSHTFPFFAY